MPLAFFEVLNNAPLGQTWAIVVGFLAGIGVFLLLGYILEKLEDDEDDEDDNSSQTSEGGVPNYSAGEAGETDLPETRERKQSQSLSKIGQMQLFAQLHQTTKGGGGQVSNELTSLNVPLTSRNKLPPFPWMFAAAVVIDAFVDGFLIGVRFCLCWFCHFLSCTCMPDCC